MYKQYRNDIAPGDTSGRLDSFWAEHWGGQDLATLEQGLERTDLWRFFRDWLPEGGRVLEAGCGPAHWVKFLGERGFAAMGLDFSRAALVESKRVASALPLINGELTTLPFATGAFDAYVSLGVIEHFEEGPRAVLAEARRVVRPGGVLLFSVPYMSLAKRLHRAKASLRGTPPPSPPEAVFYQYVMSGRELSGLLRGAGLEVVAVRPFEVEGGLQNRLPSVGGLKQRIRRSENPWMKRVTPLLHDAWDLALRLLPASSLAHMVMAVCRNPSS